MNNEIENIDENEYINDEGVTSPFSTKDIKITNATISLASLIERLKYDEIDLNPDFQRNANLWKYDRMSRLIESILLKLPLPIFYFDVSNPDKWIVVDGLQRLSTINKFVVEQTLKLKNLEFLSDLEGEKYDGLDRNFIRIINETQIVTYQIEAQTPKQVRYSIFNRINTGGLSLNAQEVRQALNQSGHGVKFLKEVVETKEFQDIVNISSKRMLDRELALRFIAFKLSPVVSFGFQFNNMGEFLDYGMEKLDIIDDQSKLTNLKEDLIDALIFSEEVLGKEHRFSRSIADDNKTNTLNRSVFDVITVLFSEIKNKEYFLLKKDLFHEKFIELLRDEESEFSRSVTKGTSAKSSVVTRFRIIHELIEEIINEN